MAKYKNPRFVKDELEADNLIKEFEEEVKIEAEKPKDEEDATFKKRYSDLRRYQQEKEREFNEKIQELEARLSEAHSQKLHLPKTDEELQEWMSKYPDVSGLIDTLVRKRIMEGTKQTEEKLKELDKLREETKFKDAYSRLIEAHPDFPKIQKDSAFHDWIAEQREAGREWVYTALFENNTDWEFAAKAVQFYKDTALNTKDETRAEPVKNKSAAARVTRPQASKEISHNDYDFTESQIAKMSGREYEKQEDKIMEALRKGRVLMDITGAAR